MRTRRTPSALAARLAVVACLAYAVAGCTGTAAEPTAAEPTHEPTRHAPSPSPPPTPVGKATAAPSWLGTRVLPVGQNGFAAAQKTPPELRNRSLVTVDELPPPADGRFHATAQKVPPGVLARSSWTKACPVAASDLRYLTVSFRGFDGRAHTGELLVNKRAANGLTTVFRRLFAAGYPIERMHISSSAELNAPPTGDDNNTEAYACRPVRGSRSWSQHAYGLAVDVNPFQNPYHKGEVVLPELATAYLYRHDDGGERPGIMRSGGPAVRAFAAIGWKWGGNYRSLKDYMHFSLTGG